MHNHICKTCGAHYRKSAQPPAQCIICEDDRQYVPQSGQAWATYDELSAQHANSLTVEEPNLKSIGITPKFAIGQRALLLQTPQGNVLWDCVPLIDDATVAAINALGGIQAIALSHPHFYSGIAEWSSAFGDVPIYLHANDRKWVTRGHQSVSFWEGARMALFDGVTLMNLGGHFPGSSVLHWRDGADGKGVLLTADTIYPVSNRRRVTFMHSYPNSIPLPARKVRQIVARLGSVQFDRIYSAWVGSVIDGGARKVVADSAETYLRTIEQATDRA